MQIDVNALEVINNKDASRFEIQLEDDMAFADYKLRGTSIVFDHTVVPPAYGGQGVAHKLIKTALDSARDQGLRVIPLCPFVAAFIRENPEYQPENQGANNN